MPVFVVNLIEAQRIQPNLQKICLETICPKKFFKFLKRISCLNKLQNLHLITANLMAVKVFSLFTKAPGFSHNQFHRKPKPGAIHHQGESFSDQSQKEELQIQKEIYPLTRRTKFIQENWSKLTSNKTVLQTISGLQIPFRPCPKLHKIIPVTLPHSKEEYETLSQEIQSLKDKDAITEIPSTQAKFISRLFTVPERSEGKRPVINLAPLNNHIYNQLFKMEGLENLRYLLNPGDYFVKINLLDAYLSIPVHKDSQPYLAFILDQVTYAFKMMPFRLNVAPARFTKVFKPVLADLRAQSIRALIWLDDILVISSSYSSCIRDRDIVIDLLVNLGFRLNMEKSVLIPTQRVIYLGMVIDSLTMTFSLPEEKVSAIVQKATILKNKNQVSVRDIYQYIGMCSLIYRNVLGASFTRLAVKEAQIHYRQLQHQVITLLKENLLLRNQCYSVKFMLLPLALQDTQSFHLNFKSNYTPSSRHLHSDRRF